MFKRKDNSFRKKNAEKRARRIVTVDLTDDNEDDDLNECKIHVPKVIEGVNLPKIENIGSHDDDAAFSSDSEPISDDENNYCFPDSDTDDNLPKLSYYREDKKLPIYSLTSPDLKSIFRICLKRDIPAKRMTGKKPTNITSTSTFVVDQKLARLKHPYDVEADETPGAYEKKEQTRFYEVKVDDGGMLLISSEVSVEKDEKGGINGGTYNARDGRNWLKQVASKEHLYAVVRKRAVHKKTLETFQTAFTRYIIFVMPIAEYNEVYGKLKNLPQYTLNCPTIIMHYYFNTGKSVPIIASSHGNATGPHPRSFVSREHSLKQEVKEILRTDVRAPRIIHDEKENDIDLLDPPLLSTTIRDGKQLYNYRHSYGEAKAKVSVDQIQEVILKLLDQPSAAVELADPFVLQKNQPFVREFLLRHEKQACFVAYLQQSLTDIERFCTTSANPRFTTPLVSDTTFNIASYLVTQTTYKQLSVIGRESLKNPWFPGPFLIHRNQSTQEFSYFWQAVKRGNPALSNLLVLGTDEDEALSGGILQETKGTTIHLLGKEHVEANVEKKLLSLNFPSLQRKIIMSDIFGGSTCKEEDSLYGSESVLSYSRKLLQLKSKWLHIEKEHTSNRPANQFVEYFEAHKEKQIREKMIKGVRKQASIDATYGQNPIEWQNFLAKDEISAHVRSEGRSHRDATLTESLDALKARSIRLYSNVVKALYDDGPYVISTAYNMFRKTYAEWQSMSRDDRKKHISAFMAYIPTDDVILRIGSSAASKNPIGKNREVMAIPTCSSSCKETPDEIQIIPTAESDVLLQPQQSVVNRTPPTSSDQFEVSVETQGTEVTEGHLRRTLSVSLEEASVLEDILPSHLLEDAFRKAEELLNEPNSITKAATDDDRLRTVKSRHGSVPLIVKPLPKNRDLFECTCKVYKALGMCCDTIAVADEVGVLCNYLCELRKKLGKRKKRGKAVNITAAVQSDLSASLKGHKKNEVQKISRRKSNSFQQESIAEDLVQRRSATTHTSFPLKPANKHIAQQPSPNYSVPDSNHSTQCVPTWPRLPMFQSPYQSVITSPHSTLARDTPQYQYASTPSSTIPHGQPFSYTANPYINANPVNQFSDTSMSVQQQTSARRNMSDVWNSSMSPYRYELVLIPNSVTKCYGCHQDFTPAYRSPPNNVIVRHMDRRITGRDQSGQLAYSPDFKATYYHPVKEHIILKNPVFDGRVFVAPVFCQILSPEQIHVVNNVINLDVNYL